MKPRWFIMMPSPLFGRLREAKSILPDGWQIVARWTFSA